MKTISEHSAGGIVYRPLATRHAPRAILWLICKHSGYHKWVLPKGIVEAGEKPEEAAVREVEEETGVMAKILKKITPDVRYKYTKNGTLINKSVEFFLMEHVSGDIKNHNWEMEGVRWASKDEALKSLAFPTEQRVLRTAIKQLSLLNH